jgi:acid stress-induced BolA-like protein IbaG/YrbA
LVRNFWVLNLKIENSEELYPQEQIMINPEDVKQMIQSGLQDAEVYVQDLTGGGDHYQVTVVSAEFEGKSLVQQHRLVYGTVNAAMASDAIHAFALKTYTPEKWAAQPNAAIAG